MKIVARPITVYSWADPKGVVHPYKFKLEENDEIKEINIDRLVYQLYKQSYQQVS
jgi:hypothetical protein